MVPLRGIPATATILQASASATGGAGTVMTDLHREYLRRGLDSWVAVGSAAERDPRVLEIPNDAMRSAWSRALSRAARTGTEERSPGALQKALLLASDPERYLGILAGAEDFGYPGSRALLGLPPRAPDLLHLHNLHGYYFDLRSLPEMSRRVPTVLTMHDAWLLTGHCAHPFECRRWMTGCGDCPDLGIYPPVRRDATASNWRQKRDILRRSRLGLVSPSRWLHGLVRDTLDMAEDLRVRLIPNGVDVATFHPGDRLEARADLGLPPDSAVLLAAAESLSRNPFKDFATLRTALPEIADRHAGPVLLVALGEEEPAVTVPGVEIVAVPYVRDAARMAVYYRAADVYVHAARAENLPLTILEAMACGTPVVASDVGGVGELVTNEESGLLFPVGDHDALARAVLSLLADAEHREALGRAGLVRVLGDFTLEREADAYLDFYGELREAWGGRV